MQSFRFYTFDFAPNLIRCRKNFTVIWDRCSIPCDMQNLKLLYIKGNIIKQEVGKRKEKLLQLIVSWVKGGGTPTWANFNQDYIYVFLTNLSNSCTHRFVLSFRFSRHQCISMKTRVLSENHSERIWID